MKRVIALVLLLSGVMALFVFNVSAENTFVRQLRNYSNSISSAGLTYSVTAAQLGYVTESTLNGGMHSPILVTARLTNNGTQDVKIANSYIDLTFTTYSQLSAYDCYTSDLMVQMVKNGNDTPRYNVVASNGYSYGGHIVVPALSSLYLVFEVDIEASYNTSTGSVVSPSLDAVLFYINSNDVVVGNYPTTGSIPEQLDELDNHIQTLIGYVYGDNQNLVNLMQQVGGIKNLLTEIKALIQFTGTYSQSNGSSTTATITETLTNTGATVTVIVRYLPSYYLTDDIEIASSNTVVKSGTRVTPASIYIRITNSNRYTIATAPSWTITGLGTETKDFGQLYSDDFELPFFANQTNIALVLKHRLTSYGYISDTRDHYSVLYYNIYTDSSTNAPNASNLNIGITYTREAISTEYFPDNEYYILRDIFLGMQSSSSSDITYGSNTLNQTESQVHQQEQLYFQQNAQAILDTGLSNYRFNTEQSNGIGAVSIDFTSLWNALGSWNSVYVFALTLTIALTILRHAPNAISTSRRRNYDHNERGS